MHPRNNFLDLQQTLFEDIRRFCFHMTIEAQTESRRA
jgi:hypothetical protein